MRNAADSIANRYDINPDAYRYRLDNEGFTDRVIKDINKGETDWHQLHGYRLLHSPRYMGKHLFGLDDGVYYIENGFANPKGEEYVGVPSFIDGRDVNQAVGYTIADDMGLTGAVLKAFIDKAGKDFPEASDYDKSRYGQAYYHRGAAGGKRWVNKGAKEDKIQPDGYRFKQRKGNRKKK